MMSVTVTRTVRAPVQQVWDVATDLAGMPAVMSGIERVDVLTDGPFAVGTRWRETRRMYGKEASEEMRVMQAEAPHSYTVHADSHGMHYVTSWAFRETAENVTEVAMTFGGEATSTFARVLGVVTAPIGNRSVRKAVEQDLADLAVACEKT